MSIGIKGWGSYLPDDFFVVNNKRLGLFEQRLAPPGVSTLDIGYAAAREAIEHSGVDLDSIKACYLGTETPVFKVRPTSRLIAKKLDLGSVACMDVRFACAAGFLSLQQAIVNSSSSFYSPGDNFLVVMADKSFIESSNGFYDLVGHGGVAFVVGHDPVVEVTVDPSSNVSCSVDDFLVTHDRPDFPVYDGTLSVHTFKELVYDTVNGFLANTGFDYDRVIGHVPVPRMIDWISFNERNKLPNNPFNLPESRVRELFRYCVSDRVGNSFNANAGLNLVNALENFPVGGRILGFSYGSGALALSAGFEILEQSTPICSLESKLASGMEITSMQKNYCLIR